jgi:hypothetical protein
LVLQGIVFLWFLFLEVLLQWDFCWTCGGIGRLLVFAVFVEWRLFRASRRHYERVKVEISVAFEEAVQVQCVTERDGETLGRAEYGEITYSTVVVADQECNEGAAAEKSVGNPVRYSSKLPHSLLITRLIPTPW